MRKMYQLLTLILVILALSACRVTESPESIVIPIPENLSLEELEVLVEEGVAEKFPVTLAYYDFDGTQLSNDELDDFLQTQYSTHADCYGWVGVAAYPGSWNAYARVYLKCPGYVFKTAIGHSEIFALSPPDPNGIVSSASKRMNEIMFDFVSVLSNSLPNRRGTYYVSGTIGGRAERRFSDFVAVINPEYRARSVPYNY
jgi:hypothetical protein